MLKVSICKLDVAERGQCVKMTVEVTLFLIHKHTYIYMAYHKHTYLTGIKATSYQLRNAFASEPPERF